jgi:hypothetical protein
MGQLGRALAFIASLALSSNCSSTTATHDDDAGGAAGATVAGDAASDAPPPPCEGGDAMKGNACPTVGAACLPQSYTCCFCEQAHSCSAPSIWACVSSNPACPERAPAVGDPCTLADSISCVYCGDAPANLACNAGHWMAVTTVYCIAPQ